MTTKIPLYKTKETNLRTLVRYLPEIILYIFLTLEQQVSKREQNLSLITKCYCAKPIIDKDMVVFVHCKDCCKFLIIAFIALIFNVRLLGR